MNFNEFKVWWKMHSMCCHVLYMILLNCTYETLGGRQVHTVIQYQHTVSWPLCHSGQKGLVKGLIRNRQAGDIKI